MIEPYVLKSMLEDYHAFYNRRMTEATLRGWSDVIGEYPETAVEDALSEWMRTQRVIGTPADIEGRIGDILRGKGGSGYRANPYVDSLHQELKRMLANRDAHTIAATFRRLWKENPGAANALYWRMHDWFIDYCGGSDKWSEIQYRAVGKEDVSCWADWSPTDPDILRVFFALVPAHRIGIEREEPHGFGTGESPRESEGPVGGEHAEVGSERATGGDVREAAEGERGGATADRGTPDADCGATDGGTGELF